MVIGIGINLASHPTGLGRAATHLAAHGVSVAPEAMLGFLAEAMQRWLGVWDCGAGFARVRAAWLGARRRRWARASPSTPGRERIAGTFLGLDDSGALVMRDAQGRQRKLTFGDVTLARAAAEGRG